MGLSVISKSPVLIAARTFQGNTTFTLVRFKPRFSVVLQIFLSAEAAVVLRKVGEGLRFDCGQDGSFAVIAKFFSTFLRFSVV